MQSTHERFEFVIEATRESFTGNSQEEVFEKLPESFLPMAATPRLRARLCLAVHGIDAEPPEFSDKPKFYDEFFRMLQPPLVGTWKWYDSLIGEYWRFDPAKNDLVRRTNNGMGRKKITEEHRKSLRKNLQKANEVLISNPKLKIEAGRKGGLIGGRSCAEKRTEEEKREIARKAVEGQRRWRASLTDEEKAERRARLVEAGRRRKGMKMKHSAAWLAKKQRRDAEKAAQKQQGVQHTEKWFRKQIGKIDGQIDALDKAPGKYNHSEEWVESKRTLLLKKREELERQLQLLTA